MDEKDGKVFFPNCPFGSWAVAKDCVLLKKAPLPLSPLQKEEREWIRNATVAQWEDKYGPLRPKTTNVMKQNIHAELILEYAKDWAETNTPWVRWEYSRFPTSQRTSFHDHPIWKDSLCYFRKPEPPKFININGYEVPEPCRTPLSKRESYYLVNISNAEIIKFDWSGDDIDKKWLKKGIIHTTREAAEIHVKALLSFTAVDDQSPQLP